VFGSSRLGALGVASMVRSYGHARTAARRRRNSGARVFSAARGVAVTSSWRRVVVGVAWGV
jgi:hypothetical protein